jgi:hypothetical protein
VSPVKYELGFYVPEDDILHSHRRENLKSYRALSGKPFGIGPVYIDIWCLEFSVLRTSTLFNLPPVAVLFN